MAKVDIGDTGYHFDTDVFIDLAGDSVGNVLIVTGIGGLAKGALALGRRMVAKRAATTGAGGVVKAGAGDVVKAGGGGAVKAGAGATAKEIAGFWNRAITSWRLFAGIHTLTSTIMSMFPRLDDEIVVEVHGKPGASKRDLYFLAVAAASGMTRRWASLAGYVGPVSGALIIEYDQAEQWVRCTMRYSVGSFAASANNSSEQAGFYADVAVYNGPKCSLVGKPLTFIGPSALPGFPQAGINDSIINPLFREKVILTTCPKTTDPDPTKNPGGPGVEVIDSPNPTPPGDHRSRGVFLTARENPTVDGCCTTTNEFVNMIFATLSNPGSYGFSIFQPPNITATLSR